MAVALFCGLAFVGISSQAYPVQIHTCAIEKASCCTPKTCKCSDCGVVIVPHTPVTLTTSFQLREVVTVEHLLPSDATLPFSLTYQPLSPPPKLARV